MFQYSLAMLEALSALPRERYAIVVAFFNPAWRPYIGPLGLNILSLGVAGRELFTVGRIWRTACLPIRPWTAFHWRFDQVARALRIEASICRTVPTGRRGARLRGNKPLRDT
jgi:hypothetical protein